MHIPDGLLSAQVLAPLGALSLGGLALASARARLHLEDRPGTLPLTGVMAAFIFAAQLVNFPLPLPGVSGHLLGGVLAAILLGPHCATIALAAVFVLQALLLQDGGVLALGANTFNMGLVATFVGYGIYRGLRRALAGGRREVEVAAFAAAFLAVLLGALATYVEIAVSEPRYRGPVFLGLMTGYHVVIGAFEGAITVGALAWLRRVRPDLVRLERDPAAPPGVSWALLAQILVVAAALGGIYALGLTSERPDGLERAMEQVAPAPTPAPTGASAGAR